MIKYGYGGRAGSHQFDEQVINGVRSTDSRQEYKGLSLGDGSPGATFCTGCGCLIGGGIGIYCKPCQMVNGSARWDRHPSKANNDDPSWDNARKIAEAA